MSIISNSGNTVDDHLKKTYKLISGMNQCWREKMGISLHRFYKIDARYLVGKFKLIFELSRKCTG